MIGGKVTCEGSHDPADRSIRDPFLPPPQYSGPGILSAAGEADIRASFEREGFYRFRLLNEAQADAISRAVLRDLSPDVLPNAPRNYTSGKRVQDGWDRCPHVRALASDPVALALLRLLYRGAEPFPFQTLNFFTGTEQPAHSDLIHFRPDPDPSMMCGIWVALEDVDETSGPLVYYPGSHHWPVADMRDVRAVYENARPGTGSYFLYEAFIGRELKARGAEPSYLTVKKGEALVWAANLIHGGAPVKDRARTRLSQVTHYFFDGSDSYWTPLLSELDAGDKRYRDPLDVRTGRPRRFERQTRPKP